MWADTILPGLYLYDNDDHDAHSCGGFGGSTYEIVTNGTVVGMRTQVPRMHDGTKLL